MAGFASTVNFARIARVVALFCFLMPWTMVSCSSRGIDQLGDRGSIAAPSADIPMASASGLQLATGTISYSDSVPLRSAADDVSRLFDKPNQAVAGAALLILLGFAASFVLSGALRALVGIASAALAAAALCYGVAYRIPLAVHELYERRGGGGMGIEIHVGLQTGFYLCLAALIAAALFDFPEIRKKAGAPAPAMVPPAEPPPPGI